MKTKIESTISKEISKSASIIGRLGGKSLAKKRGKKYMQQIGRAGSVARWGSKGNDIKNK